MYVLVVMIVILLLYVVINVDIIKYLGSIFDIVCIVDLLNLKMLDYIILIFILIYV